MNDYKYRVLLIEDEEEQLKAIKDTIERSTSLKKFVGEVDTRIVNPEEGASKVAEEIAEQSPKWNIIVADLFMPTPERGGLLIADNIIECLEKDPELPVRLILISNKKEAAGALREYYPKYRKWIYWYPKHKITSEDYKRNDLADLGLWGFAIGEAIKKLFKDSIEETSYEVGDLEVGLSAKMRIAKTEAEMLAKNATGKTNILILGESGTGKEVFAEFIHQVSPFKNGNFISVNCAGLPDTLIESELFGYKKGAFAGAERNKKGKFDDAQNGVIFLDEIGDLDPKVQPKLNRVLDPNTREYTALGDEGIGAIKRFNGIVIGATLKPIDKMQNGSFREDLFCRFQEVIRISPLRERTEDIIPLGRHFIEKLSKKRNLPERQLSADAQKLLSDYDWPGNVRELENIIEKAFRLSDRDELIVQDFPNLLQRRETSTTEVQENIALYPPEKFVLSFKGTRRKDIKLTDQETKDKIERGITILRGKGISKREIARLMGYRREYLYEWTQEWGIDLKEL